jgi:hypothetical protein
LSFIKENSSSWSSF